MGPLLAVLAAAIYLITAIGIASSRGQARPTWAGAAAVAAHAASLWLMVARDGHLAVGVTEALSLFSWQAAALLWGLCLVQPVQSLAVAIYPAAAAAALAACLWPSSLAGIPLLDWKIQLHVALSLFSAGVLSLAAVQALTLAIQDRRLHGRTVADAGLGLPPLQTMESILFQLIGAGFFMLSLSLATGLLFVDDLLAQHLAHKTVLTGLAWALFGILLWGRWFRGWRGATALRWTLSGYSLLILGYFGSKFVLEQILGKHWT